MYTYKELYGGPQLARLADVALDGRLVDVTAIVMEARYDVPLHFEDYWLVREALPERMLAPEEAPAGAEEASGKGASAAWKTGLSSIRGT